MRKAILIASGEYNKEYSFCSKDYIVAIDGGYDYLLNQNIKPNLIIGDFDSLKATLPKSIETITLPTNKDDTDSLFAIKECLKRGFTDFELYGFLGNDIAHTLANLQTLHYLKNKNCNGKIFHKKQIIEILNNETKTIEKHHRYFSLFSITDMSIVTLKNCKYPLNKQTIKNIFPIGLHNEFIDKDVEIEIHSGICIIVY